MSTDSNKFLTKELEQAAMAIGEAKGWNKAIATALVAAYNTNKGLDTLEAIFGKLGFTKELILQFAQGYEILQRTITQVKQKQREDIIAEALKDFLINSEEPLEHTGDEQLRDRSIYKDRSEAVVAALLAVYKINKDFDELEDIFGKLGLTKESIIQHLQAHGVLQIVSIQMMGYEKQECYKPKVSRDFLIKSERVVFERVYGKSYEEACEEAYEDILSTTILALYNFNHDLDFIETLYTSLGLTRETILECLRKKGVVE